MKLLMRAVDGRVTPTAGLYSSVGLKEQLLFVPFLQMWPDRARCIVMV